MNNPRQTCASVCSNRPPRSSWNHNWPGNVGESTMFGIHHNHAVLRLVIYILMWYRVIVTSVGFLQFHILYIIYCSPFFWFEVIFSCRIVWILTLFFGGYQYHPLTNQPVAINPGHDGGESGGTPWRPSDVCGRCRKLLRDRSGELRAGHRSRNCDSCTVVNYTYRTLGKIILCLVLVLLSVAEGSLEVSVVARGTFPINMHETLTTTHK